MFHNRLERVAVVAIVEDFLRLKREHPERWPSAPVGVKRPDVRHPDTEAAAEAHRRRR